LHLRITLLIAILAAAQHGVAENAWPTLHHDVMRTGRTADSPGVPFTRL
jgi:hypothetical protein